MVNFAPSLKTKWTINEPRCQRVTPSGYHSFISHNWSDMEEQWCLYNIKLLSLCQLSPTCNELVVIRLSPFTFFKPPFQGLGLFFKYFSNLLTLKGVINFHYMNIHNIVFIPESDKIFDFVFFIA